MACLDGLEVRGVRILRAKGADHRLEAIRRRTRKEIRHAAARGVFLKFLMPDRGRQFVHGRPGPGACEGAWRRAEIDGEGGGARGQRTDYLADGHGQFRFGG
jgi:hypothetical protein